MVSSRLPDRPFRAGERREGRLHHHFREWDAAACGGLQAERRTVRVRPLAAAPRAPRGAYSLASAEWSSSIARPRVARDSAGRGKSVRAGHRSRGCGRRLQARLCRPGRRRRRRHDGRNGRIARNRSRARVKNAGLGQLRRAAPAPATESVTLRVAPLRPHEKGGCAVRAHHIEQAEQDVARLTRSGCRDAGSRRRSAVRRDPQ